MIIDADVRQELKELLQDSDVYVFKGPVALIFNGLYAVVKEDLKWPEKKIGEQDTTQVTKSKTIVEEPQDRMKFVTTRQVERRGLMDNLFKDYSNDKDGYLGSMTDKFDQKFRLSSKNAIKLTYQRMLDIVHFPLILPEMLVNSSSITYRSGVRTWLHLRLPSSKDSRPVNGLEHCSENEKRWVSNKSWLQIQRRHYLCAWNLITVDHKVDWHSDIVTKKMLQRCDSSE